MLGTASVWASSQKSECLLAERLCGTCYTGHACSQVSVHGKPAAILLYVRSCMCCHAAASCCLSSILGMHEVISRHAEAVLHAAGTRPIQQASERPSPAD